MKKKREIRALFRQNRVENSSGTDSGGLVTAESIGGGILTASQEWSWEWSPTATSEEVVQESDWICEIDYSTVIGIACIDTIE